MQKMTLDEKLEIPTRIHKVSNGLPAKGGDTKFLDLKNTSVIDKRTKHEFRDTIRRANVAEAMRSQNAGHLTSMSTHNLGNADRSREKTPEFDSSSTRNVRPIFADPFAAATRKPIAMSNDESRLNKAKLAKKIKNEYDDDNDTVIDEFKFHTLDDFKNFKGKYNDL